MHQNFDGPYRERCGRSIQKWPLSNKESNQKKYFEMENLSTEQSLRIIRETLEKSRRSIARNSGKPLISWGLLLVAFSMIIWQLWARTGSPAWNFLWFAMSAIGFIVQYFLLKDKEKVPDSEVGRMLGKIWMWYGIIATVFFASIWLCVPIAGHFGLGGIQVNLTLVMVLLLGLAGAISGAVLKIPSMEILSAVAAILCSMVAILVDGPAQILTIGIIGVCALLVPGIILQRKAAE